MNSVVASRFSVAVEQVEKALAAMVSCVALIQSPERATREMRSSSMRPLKG